MNYQLFLFILNIILLSRLKLTFKDGGAGRGDIIKIALVPLTVLILLQINLSWFLLLVYLLGYPFLTYYAETKIQKLNRNRGLILLLHIIVIGIFCSPLFSLAANTLPEQFFSFLENVMFPGITIMPADALHVQIMIFGILMVVNEVNIVLRYLLQVLRLEALGEESREVDESEYNTGRVIGLLERIFVFVFVLAGQYTAVGFILAAKGVARFQDFKSRTFAEYVLIGTLISTLLAMIMAFVSKAAL